MEDKAEDAQLKAILEGLIFVSESPLTLDRMKEVLGVPKKDLQRLLSEMIEDCRRADRGFLLTEVAEGFQFRTRPEHSAWIKKLKKVKTTALSQPALETLAIVAYRQPVVRMDIEKVRGVDSGGVLHTLLGKKLIKIIGKKDIPGKPLVYGTSRKFLEVFGLKDLSELPTLKDLEGLGPPSTEGILSLEGEKAGGEEPKIEKNREALIDEPTSEAPKDSF
ncbi:MAG TPA: SMC-Scp complex subunit ScpB [Thermodesulfobacteriota bacterium]|nr:SMC-Scp complex subunit ScpB [Thermodesulfobacteriota bacterium]